MKLKCECCKIEREFKDAVAAFECGWDAPPHWSHVACELCPADAILGKQTHKKAHALWKKNGRPAEFELETCATDDIISDPEEMAKAAKGMLDLEVFIRDLNKSRDTREKETTDG